MIGDSAGCRRVTGCCLAALLLFAAVRAGRAQEGVHGAGTLDALAKKAAAAREAGRLDEALSLYRSGIAAKPDWNEGLWYVGSILYELERHDECRDAFAQLVSRQPAHAGAVGMKGLCEFQIGRHDEALRSLLRARSLGVASTPEVAGVVRYHAGILLTKFGEFEVGYSVLSEFAADGNESAAVIDAFGLNLLRVPALPSEIDAARRPLVQLAGRAASAMAGRRVAAAQPLLDELIAKYPAAPNVHYARGVFRLTESPETALEDFEREIAVTPSHVPARLQIAFELIRRGEAAQARPFAEQAVALDPGHFAARLALGQALLELSDTEGAIAELERAAKLAAGSPQVQFMLARAYARAGRAADADRARAEFTRLDQLARTQRAGAQAVGGIPAAPPK